MTLRPANPRYAKYAAVLLTLFSFGLFAVPTPAATDPGDDRVAAVESGLRPPVSFEGETPWTIQERMEHYGVPAVSLAVIHEGRIAWSRTYGLADRETGQVATPSTLFQAGSVSKPVAAFAALLMVSDGRLDLDSDVNEFLSTWKLPDNEFTDTTAVNLAHLLSHTGGVTVHGFPGYAVDAAVPSVIQVLDGVAPANTPPIRVDRSPGEGFRYSGGGYTIAQQLMVDVSGQPYPELMHELVLGPLGMHQSTFENPLPPARLPLAAAGVLPDGTAVQGKRHTYPEMAAAGLWTTAEDLARFALEVQNALRGEGRLMSRAMAERMLEPVDAGYGLGFGIEEREGATYFGHGGWDAGFCAELSAHRSAGYGVVVLINSNHPAFISELIRAVALTYGWEGYRIHDKRDIPPVALEQLPGRYRYNAELAFEVRRDDGRLFMQYVGEDAQELHYIGDDQYLRRERDARITFSGTGDELLFQFLQPDGGRQSHTRLAEGEMLPRELLHDGDYDAALAAYRALLENDPDEIAVSESYLNDRGLSALNSDVEHAIALLRVAADLYPESANTWDSLGLAYRQAGDTARAIEYYRLALARDPRFPSALEALAELEAEQQP